MLVIGHRGASGAHPENTEAAFRAVTSMGADGVELDVRRTGDGALAVLHDPHLPDGRAVIDLDAADLPDGVLTLPQALDACAGLGLVNIEMKDLPGEPGHDPGFGLVDDVLAVLGARGELGDPRYLVSSFHLAAVDRVRERAPGVRTGWLLIDASDPQRSVDTTARHGHGALHPHHLFTGPDLVRLAHEAGIAVHTWTCDDPDRIRWLADIGCDAVMADHPDAALQALGR